MKIPPPTRVVQDRFHAAAVARHWQFQDRLATPGHLGGSIYTTDDVPEAQPRHSDHAPGATAAEEPPSLRPVPSKVMLQKDLHHPSPQKNKTHFLDLVVPFSVAQEKRNLSVKPHGLSRMPTPKPSRCQRPWPNAAAPYQRPNVDPPRNQSATAAPSKLRPLHKEPRKNGCRYS